MTDPLVAALSPDEANDLMQALEQVIDKHAKYSDPEDEEVAEQVNRWRALSERIDTAGDWEVIR